MICLINLTKRKRERHNLPASYPYRPTQTVGLASWPIGLTSSPVDDSSRFSPPASGPLPNTTF